MTILNIDLDHKLEITTKALNGTRIAVLGIPGSGKSNTIGVLLEENVPFNTGVTILDMHDEYWGLKQKFPFLRVGKNQPFREGAERKSPPVDLELNAGNAASFAEHVFLKRIPTIVNLRWMKKDERQEVVLRYIERLYDLNMSYGRPYWVVLEEAHTFIPEGRKTPEQEKINEFAAEGRKLGFTIILGSQRTAKIDKDVLSSCDMFFLHRVSIELDVRAYNGLLPSTITKQRDLFITMRPGQAVVKWQKNGLPQYDIVQIREQTTLHVGATPDAEEAAIATLQTIDMDTLREFKPVASSKVEPQPVTAATANGSAKPTLELAHLKRINAAQTLTIALLASCSGRVAEPIPAKPLPALMTQNGLSKQQRSFNALIKDVVNGCQRPFHLQILRYLLERDDVVMSIKDMARFVGLSESTIRSNPPIYLCQSPVLLLQRDHDGKDFIYWSIARETLADRFPDLNVDELVQKLLEVGN